MRMNPSVFNTVQDNFINKHAGLILDINRNLMSQFP